MPSEVATTRKRKTAVRIQKIQDEVYTTVDIDDAPDEIQSLAGALLDHINCCEPMITDVRSFNGFGDDTYWQIGISHEMLIYEDGRPVPHGRTTIVRISDRG